MKLKIWEISLAIALVVTLLCGFTLDSDQQDLSEKMIRLHVVADSNSEADQTVKLEVRDAVLAELQGLLDGVTDKDKAVEVIRDNLQEIDETATEELESHGYMYGARVTIMQERFPTREYETFSLPAGEYTSLRIILGSGQGHNWWCVVFPPLCTAAATEKDLSAVSLTENEVSLITEEDSGYVIKFKAIEIIESIKQWFEGK